MSDIERDLRNAALDQLHIAQQRIAALEAQLKAAREEVRRYVAMKMTDQKPFTYPRDSNGEALCHHGRRIACDECVSEEEGEE